MSIPNTGCEIRHVLIFVGFVLQEVHRGKDKIRSIFNSDRALTFRFVFRTCSIVLC